MLPSLVAQVYCIHRKNSNGVQVNVTDGLEVVCGLSAVK